MNLKEGKLCLSRSEMQHVVATALNSMFIGTIHVSHVWMNESGLRPFEIVFGEPAPVKLEKKR